MKFIAISKFLLISILPFIIFLVVLDAYAFENSFYKEKFSEYNVYAYVPKADILHETVIRFIQGQSNNLPDDFNEREKQHLRDVRILIKTSKAVMYTLIMLLILLSIVSAEILKSGRLIINFFGKILLFAGLLTVIISAALFFLINSDFSAAFESFHKLLFNKGTYMFDPSKEIIVNLYPEQLFEDIGIKVSKAVIVASAIIILSGTFLLIKSKRSRKEKISSLN